jgi:HPt (histidine-containing phosphotransfer) domain-containing protein
VRTIIDWSLEYHGKYGRAPGKDIEKLFLSRKDSLGDSQELVKTFLESISEEFSRAEQFNSAYAFDEARRYLHRAGLKKLAAKIEDLLASGNTEDADRLVNSWSSVAIEEDDISVPLSDKEKIISSFDTERKNILSFPGALGKLMNPHMVRGGFVTLMGPEKRGKTWWLIELTMRALISKCRVAFFGAGDMSSAQMTRRFLISLVGKSDDVEYCGKILVPTLDCRKGQCGLCTRFQGLGLTADELMNPDMVKEAFVNSGQLPCPKIHCKKFVPTVGYKVREAVTPLTWREAYKAGKIFERSLGSGNRLRLACYPTEVLTFGHIENKLEQWKKEGWIPDLVVVDYMDIMASKNDKATSRDQINERWMGGRRLSLKWHLLLLSATQSDAQSYETRSLRMKNFSDDKRKFSHVTATFGLNQTEEEKDAGIMRINTVVAREGKFSSSNEVVVIQSLEIGRPHLGSYFPKKAKVKVAPQEGKGIV